MMLRTGRRESDKCCRLISLHDPYIARGAGDKENVKTRERRERVKPQSERERVKPWSVGMIQPLHMSWLLFLTVNQEQRMNQEH